MGYQTIMLTILASVLLSMTILGLTGMWDQSTATVVTQANEEQAVNVATSGINLAIHKLRMDKSWRTGFSNLPMAGGRVTLTVTDLGLDTVRIRSTGSTDSSQHTSIAVCKLSSIFPVVQSALTVFGDSVKFSNAGKAFLIDGNDYLPDGITKGGYPPVWGLGVTKSAIDSSVTNQINKGSVADEVIGAGGNPSVGVFTNVDLINLRNQYRSLATMEIPPGSYTGNAIFGTVDAPQVVHVGGDADWNGTISGAGILVVDGDLKLAGNITWKGIVITVSGDVTMDLGGSGNPNLWGTTWVGSDVSSKITNLNINGNPSIKYSYEIIQQVLANLDLLAVEVISWYE